jgi:DNA-binding NtrC family response regulator
VKHSSTDIRSSRSRGAVASDRIVLICDVSGHTKQEIARVIAHCGATSRWADDADDLARLPAQISSACCTTAVVSIGRVASGDPRPATLIKALSEKGFSVIACMDGASALPLAGRCQLYLAGCVSLLDSGDAAFPEDLERTLVRMVAQASHANAEDERIRAIMADVGAVGESPALLSVFRRLARISPLSDLSTLITGETGTGKELLARALYAQDAKRRSGAFVSLNCSAISPMLAESELFGHRRGAFTGAERDRKGLIRAADGGVLFLDEIAELSVQLQAKLLRVLQEGRVLAVGDEREVAVSVRIIAATNADLRAMVDAGTFRADLFHRLNVLSLHLPPLRERRADIPPLVAHFARRHGTLNPGMPVTWHGEFVDALCQLDLPGNARQLENLVRWALVHNSTGRLELGDLPPEVWEQLAHKVPATTALATTVPATTVPATTVPATTVPATTVLAASLPPDPVGLLATHDWNLSRSLDSCERSIIATALRVSHGNQSRAARLLGITPRSVYNKVRRHKLA